MTVTKNIFAYGRRIYGFSHVTSTGIRGEPIDNLVKSFLDIIVLAMLNGEPVHGYKIIAELHRTFGVLLSPGTLYPLLYRLEDGKLVKVREFKRRKLYRLTPLGRRTVSKVKESYKKNSDKIFRFIDENLTVSTRD